MVATDTVVGIVGAVLLVAVMAGVFVYEYNNPAEADGGAGDVAEQQAHFEEDYAGMSATDDIDGDGKPNYLDEDLDGDGLNNTDDTEVATHHEQSGAIGPSGGPVSTALILEFYVGNGSVHIEAVIQLSTLVPIYSGNFAVQLIDPDGTIADDAASAATGSGSLMLETDENDEMKTGTWQVRVTNNQAGTGGNAQISADVHYSSPAEPHGH